MAELLVVKDDPVDGTDTHLVTGMFMAGSPPPAYSGAGDYDYLGAVAGGLSTLVRIDGVPLAVVTSTSSLRPAGTSKHVASAGGNFVPAGPNTGTLLFSPATGVGDGAPSASAGSSLLTVDGVKALLDGDTFDTCTIPGGKAKASVQAKGQSWVTSS